MKIECARVSTVDQKARLQTQVLRRMIYVDQRHSGASTVFQIMGSLAEFERELIIERTRAGVAAARRRGVRRGAKIYSRAGIKGLEHARRLIRADEPVGEMSETLGVSRQTLYLALRTAEGIGRPA